MPVKSWSQKDERQYEHIRKSARKAGRTTERAKEVAARTVNKLRRKEGRARSKTSRATGNPNTVLEARTVPELRNIAKKLDITGRSKMKKNELVQAIRSAR